MVWYKLIFRQNQPIHIGYIDWGVVNETQIFITGWTMWGALTKAYNVCNSELLSNNQDLFKNITCFYPCFNSNGNEILFPEYKNGEFCLGEYSEDKFRLEFVDVFVSTAIHPNSRQVVENSLHEIEYILPKSKKIKSEDKPKQLYWVGLLGLEEDKQEIENFLKKGQKIFVGGEQKYGFGELELEKICKNPDLSEWQIKDNGEFYTTPDKPIKNYFVIEDEYGKNIADKINFEGELKLIAEFKFPENKLEIKNCINVGSKIIKDLQGNLTLEKGKLILQIS